MAPPAQGRPDPAVVGTHLVLDAWSCPADLLDDPAALEAILRGAVTAGRATLIDLCVHRFSPVGVTATATLAESHIALHTWPERGYCAADLFFCNRGDPRAALAALVAGLGCRDHEVREMLRRAGPRVSDAPPPGTRATGAPGTSTRGLDA